MSQGFLVLSRIGFSVSWSINRGLERPIASSLSRWAWSHQLPANDLWYLADLLLQGESTSNSGIFRGRSSSPPALRWQSETAVTRADGAIRRDFVHEL